MSTEEAITLGKRAIFQATHRDAASGGTINGKISSYLITLSSNDF
jgi:20S proteasome alpha/beta subunit